MKAAAIFTLILLLLALGTAGYLYTTCNVTFSCVSTVATMAEEQHSVFEELTAQAKKGALAGIVFTKDIPEDTEGCQFLTYTLRMNNNTFVAADLIEIQVTPSDGDILQIGSSQALALPGRREGDLSVTILTGRNGSPARDAYVTWYMWGIPFTQKTTVGK